MICDKFGDKQLQKVVLIHVLTGKVTYFSYLREPRLVWLAIVQPDIIILYIIIDI